MPTQAEETQVKEFLKRSEIRTMRKDLLQLREADSLTERNKIAKIKTLEEQQAEEDKKIQAQNAAERISRQEVLQRNEKQEILAEKDLKNYATEQERQQIFLLESQRLGFEKQIDEIDQKKDPALKLEKNKLFLQRRDWSDKLSKILEQEKKSEDEQKLIAGRVITTTIASERKALESRRWDLDKEIQDTENKRWEAEKQIETIDGQTSVIDKSSEKNLSDKNDLRDKILGIDKQLREIYSVIMRREEEKRKSQPQRYAAEKQTPIAVSPEKNIIQQGSIIVPRKNVTTREPASIKKFETESSAAEKKQREDFLRDIEALSQKESQPNIQQKQNIVLPSVPVRGLRSAARSAPLIPPKKLNR